MIALEKLGHRICIIGNSSAGKSTLALAIAQAKNLSVCHLDQVAHIPNTNWQLKDKSLLKAEHQEFLKTHSEWVIEGNYSDLMPERFACATFIIWLDFKASGSIYRYIKRSIAAPSKRPGNLKGASRQFSFKMIRHIIKHAPKNRDKYQNLIKKSKVPYPRLKNFRQLIAYYKFWNLENR